ncbi:unnamed protein product [Cuscuta europaea]|uniref:Protein SHORTAGE IN CHIASMATA 1 n=1 Tax=Cuscuta europaea TaxID=41803 RepID=A0A9P0ZEN8_CUSEU|nr:unnamed protein product [Cuscuta europaea]
MRTRFTCADYSISNAIQAADFPRLPLPHLPPINSSGFKDLPRFDQLSIPGIYIGINQLPIDEALSKFLSECLPNSIEFDVRHPGNVQPCSGEADSSKLTSSISHQNAEEARIPIDVKQDTKYEILQFEVSELHSVMVPMEDWRTLPDISLVEKKEIPSTETMLQYPLSIHQSLYAVDEIHLATFEEKMVNYLEDSGSIQGQYYSSTTQFPLLEVDGAGLGIVSDMPTKNEFQIFRTIETQYLMGGDRMSDSEGLLGSIQVDLLECLAAKEIETEIPFPTHSFKTDILSVIEQSESSHNGSSWPRNSIIFEEPQLFDSDRSHIYEALYDAKLQIEEEMPQEAISVRSFDELIVREELTVKDSSFRSLPVPLCLDHQKSRSLHSYVEEILVGLGLLQFCVSDALYLDWHILEEVNPYCIEDSLFPKLFGDAYSINMTLELGDCEMLVYDFILSGDSPRASKKEESKETLHIKSNSIPEYHLAFGENSVSTLQIGNREAGGESSKTVTKETSLLGVPFSHFNDLDVLSNHQNFSSRKEHKKTNQLSNFDAVDENNAKDQHFLSSLSESENMEKQRSCMLVEKNCDSGSIETLGRDEVCSRMLPQFEPFDISEKVHTSDCSLSESIIVVNTKDFEKQMIISRTKTYQNILSLEEKGTQVIERDLHFPVDVIISASICIAWYNCSNIAKKSTASEETFSCLSLCVENIAASVLTSLSYAFSGCILVFEGENSFLDGIMELSDQLYAVAPGLGIDIQIFRSNSPEMTEKIILSCIEAESRKSRGMLPKMPESATLAESFLTMFPSVNPLLAHAILSSVSTLLEFLEWPPERTVSVVQKYGVSYDSISLLSALSRYGEREESKSGMTDCSSVSSVLGSEPLHFGSDSARRKRKHAGNLQEDSHPCTSDPYLSSWIPERTDTLSGPGMPNLTFDDDLFCQDFPLEVNMIKRDQNSFQSCDFLNASDLDIGDQLNRNDLSSIGVCLPQRQPFDGSISNKSDGHGCKDSRNKNKTFIAEAIDNKKNSTANCVDFSSLLHVDQELTPRVSKAAKKLHFGISDLPNFPTAAEVESSSSDWTSVSHRGQSPGERSNHDKETGFKRNINPFENNNGASEGGQSLREVHELHNHSLQGRGKLTPLSSAINSYSLPRESAWDIQFLNRIRQKSTSRKHSGLHNLCAPCYKHKDNRSKGTQRTLCAPCYVHQETTPKGTQKSPSIIELFKYQGQCAASDRSIEQKKQKCVIWPSSTSKIETTSASGRSSRTPVDKKAKRKLSFATNGSGGQTKLIWCDSGSDTPGRRL